MHKSQFECVTYRAYWFVDNNLLSVLASNLNGVHQGVRLAVGRGERLSNVLDGFVVFDLRQINGVCSLTWGQHLDVIIHGELLLRFHAASVFMNAFSSINNTLMLYATGHKRRQNKEISLVCFPIIIFLQLLVHSVGA